MATITGTTTTYNIRGEAEDFQDVIYNVDPTATPVLSGAKKRKATATQHEWQEEALAAAATNAQVEGADAPTASNENTTVKSNYCQILKKTVVVSDTSIAVRTYGRKSELARQLVNRGLELMRDCELSVCSAQTATVGGGGVIEDGTGTGLGTARQMAGLLTQSDSSVTNTAGANRALTKAIINSVINNLATETGGRQAYNIVGRHNQIAKLDAMFTTGTSRQRDFASETKVVGAVDMIQTQFGIVSVIPDHFIGTNDLLLYDPDYVAWAELQPMHRVELARTGDAERWMIMKEGTIAALHSKRVGSIRAISA